MSPPSVHGRRWSEMVGVQPRRCYNRIGAYVARQEVPMQRGGIPNGDTPRGGQLTCRLQLVLGLLDEVQYVGLPVVGAAVVKGEQVSVGDFGIDPFGPSQVPGYGIELPD